MPEKTKKVEEIFNDYKTNANIKYANINGLNVIKKTNTLQVILSFDEYIDIKEIWYFEKFLIERFKFEYVDIKINYHEQVEKKPIETEWKSIIAYMSHKYPLTKPLLLLKSDIEVLEKEIKVKMHIKGAEFLKAKKTDKELQKVLKNLFGKEYNIDITEEISKEDMKAFKESIEREEKQFVKKAEENMKQNELKEDNQVPEYNNVDYMPPTDVEGYIPEETENMENISEIEDNILDTQEYIMGKPSKAREKNINIKDITANDGRVTLEGRVINSELRETKSGKGMIIFDLYDGSGTITVKSFAKDMIEGNEIIGKIEKAIAIKTIGKAGLDTYAGDITVISNIIIKTNTNIPEPPEEEETPQILRNITKYYRKFSNCCRFRSR